ncbi:hypothetical protein C0992_006071, partial [Termitomyces sp. T32_za158]
NALQTHIRILFGAVNNASIPEDPDLHTINTFQQRFSSAMEVDRILKGNANAASFRGADQQAMESLRDLRIRCAQDPTSNIVLGMSRVPENALRMIFATVHSFGLPAWRPDLVGGTATSLYNGALEMIAIWTFEQAAATFAYQHFSPNLTYLHDMSVIQKLYRNFVWSYIRNLVMKEKKEPGSIARSLQENKAYKNRQELTTKRRRYLRDNGWNSRIQALAEDNECTSDQEDNPAGNGFLIMRKTARNPHITDFYRMIDNARVKSKAVFRGQRKNTFKEAPRIHDPANRESRISDRLPRGCPLDWFDPSYFNSMDIRFRALYINAPIALPRKEDCVTNDLTPDWKTMAKEDFMKNYGDRVRALYNLPTQEELDALVETDDESEVE